ncbi:NAD(P)-binding protein [Periconia macrospinosa]|uniref:NAD(P)-binding protein n=1 Tax=Periconia macrospinosa TaxID=97972 RepID=A0A2V1DFN1_9PLEO|nr:NAD(P)-binding protein [Periconia macrospinosa]
MPGDHFDKKTSPNLTDQAILITGGIGAEIIKELLKHNLGYIIFPGCNAKSAEAVTKRVQKAAPTAAITFIACDLASLASVKAAADKILADLSHLDIFMANAGIMSKPAGFTGFRAGQFHFDRLKTTMEGPMGRGLRYSNSKLANILYVRELAKRYPKLLAFSLTPGVVGTSLVSDLTLTDRIMIYASQLGRVRTPEQGSFNHLWAISSPRDSIKRGPFYEPVGKVSKIETTHTKDPELPGKL